MAHALSRIFHSGKHRMAWLETAGKGQPWHFGQTNTICWKSPPSLEQVIIDLEAYVDVVVRPTFDMYGQPIEEMYETWRPTLNANKEQLYDDKQVPLGTRVGLVGPDYNVMQDHQVINWFQPWMNAGVIAIETAGAVLNHSRFWVLGKLLQDQAEVVKDDPIEQYVVACNGHDGKLAFKAFPTTVRVECNNRLQMALKSSLAKRFNVKHRSNILLGAEDVRTEIQSMQGLFLGNLEKYKMLAAHDVKSEADLKLYFQKFLGKKEDPGQKVEKDSKRPLGALMRLFEESPDLQKPKVKGTYYAAMNCVTNFLSHLKGRTSDVRLNQMMSGIEAELLDRALDLAIQGANGQLLQEEKAA